MTGISSIERAVMKKFKVNDKVQKTHLTVNRIINNYENSVNIFLSKHSIYFDKMLANYLKVDNNNKKMKK